MSRKENARHEAVVADYVAQLKELDAERYAAESRLATAEAVLLDVEGSLLGYWTDMPETEVQRLTTRIRSLLGEQP